ncbi:MAG: RdgB/HAM1 family non-canonical purine NTP pyrophosphatase [Acidimicrobiia bacterium]
MELVLATQNEGKVAEIAHLLSGLDLVVRARPDGLDETVEDAATLEGNAAKKAREVCEATGTVSLADDTGLFVDALNGEPGVRTARYGGWERLLAELEAAGDRSARFRTVLVLAFPDDRPDLVVDGVVEGVIAAAPAGNHGFGYDPVFVPAGGDGRSFAEMSKQEKNRLSHRGIALRRLVGELGRSIPPS